MNQELEKLPEQDQKILRLKYAERMSYAQIAGVLGIKPSQASTQLTQAIFKVRKELKPNDPGADIMAFIHGELDSQATNAMAQRIQSDDELRREFETLLETSDQLDEQFKAKAEDFIAPPPTPPTPTPAVKVKPATPAPVRTPHYQPQKSYFSYYVAAALAVAVGVAGVVASQTGLPGRTATTALPPAVVNEDIDPPENTSVSKPERDPIPKSATEILASEHTKAQATPVAEKAPVRKAVVRPEPTIKKSAKNAPPAKTKTQKDGKSNSKKKQ